ncbi:gp491 [Bacillus phage G]|uniref:Gp491 n=1 Tax=Bacillus phage G TaxID=2884420 RepID=G3MAN2_9CAUD|nr:gp491 [Bacillus phage G]AEO93749.1 gp491 [Bacillus phage G]
MIRVEDIKYCLEETRECLELVESFFLAADLAGNINYKRTLELKNYSDFYMYMYKISIFNSNIAINIREYKDEEKDVYIQLTVHLIVSQQDDVEIDEEKVDYIKKHLDEISGASSLLKVRKSGITFPFLHLVVPVIDSKDIVEILNFIEEKILIEGVTK